MMPNKLLGIITRFMKPRDILGIALTAIFIAGCSKQAPPNDAQIRERIVGAWSASDSKQFSVRFESDGSFSGRDKKVWAAGTWSVQDGVITVSTTNSSLTNVIPVEKAQVIRMNRHEMAFRPID